jgi:predicted GTPase
MEQTTKKIIIAIDGFSSCGKSTFAKAIAARLGYIFIDTGAMYRAVTLYALEHGAIVDGKVAEDRVVALLPDVNISFRFNAERGASDAYVNGERVEDKIRSIEVSNMVSHVSSIAQVRENLKFMAYAPILFISALTGQRTNKVLEKVKEVYAESRKRITTGLLNDILTDAQAALQPPATSGRRLKIYYATQQGVQPPTFVMFVNDENLMHFSYERYLEKQFRKSFGFEGTPLKFILREKKKDEQ